MNRKAGYRRYLLIYTVLFSAVFLCVFSPFLIQGKNLIGKGDGQSQYILQLRYMGEWLRKTFSGFLHGDFHPDRFDYTIGMGDDIDAVVRFHPLDFLSVFVPSSGTEALYNALTVLRCYLAGLSVSAYTLHFRNSFSAALSGALVYVFCGFTFGLGIVHPTYLSHMILFPLMMLGAERMMDPERNHSFALFTVTVALGFISNYYFMYISSFGLLGYVLIRFFSDRNKRRKAEFFSLLIRMQLAYLLGLALSGIFLFPALARYLGSMRADHTVERNSLLVYSDKRRYAAWFLNLITPFQASGNGTHLNYAVTLLPALALIFTPGRRKGETRSNFSVRKQFRAGFLALLLCLLVPGLGYVLAAMNNENNRWVYLIAFAAAAAVSFTADRAAAMDRRERRILLVVTVLFDAGCAGWYVLTREAVYHLAAAAELTLYAAVLTISSVRAGKRRPEQETVLRPDFRKRTESVPGISGKLVLLFTALSAVLSGYLTFSPRFGNLVTFYQDRGTAFSRYEGSFYSVYTDVPEYTGKNGDGTFGKGFYRVDGVRKSYWEDNSSLVLKYPGIQIYNSIVNADQLRSMIQSGSDGLSSILHIHSLDGRTVQEELAGVKYFAASGKNAASVPYGYSSEPVSSRKGYDLYENLHPLAFGFTADTVIRRSDYDALSPAAGELVMLRAAVVDDGTEAAARLRRTDGAEEESEVSAEDAEWSADDRISRDGVRLKTGPEKGTIAVAYEEREGYECWLSLEGLRLIDGRDLSESLTVTGDGIRKSILLSRANSSYTRGTDDYIVNLGTAERSRKTGLRITVPENLSVELDHMRLLYLPLAGYEEKIRSLNGKTLEHVSFSGDHVSGTVTLDSPRYMIFQIPYSRGWTAEVNGKKVAPDRADLCYLGLLLGSGTSEIRLVYHSPGLRAGAVLTLSGLVLLAALLFARGRMRKKNRLRKKTG